MTPKEAAIRLREWYQAFKNFGKGDERTVKELLEAADLIESLAADLDTLQQFTKELGAWNEELQKEKFTLSLRVKQLEAERDAAVAELANSDSPCDFCKYLKKFAHETPCNNCVHVLHGEESQFKWRGVQKEETT